MKKQDCRIGKVAILPFPNPAVLFDSRCCIPFSGKKVRKGNFLQVKVESLLVRKPRDVFDIIGVGILPDFHKKSVDAKQLHDIPTGTLPHQKYPSFTNMVELLFAG